MRPPSIDFIFKGVLLFLIYFISAIAGLKVDAVSGFATLVWLPTGISIAVLYFFGNKLWPFILLAAFAANLYTGAPILAALGIGIGNMLEAYVAVYLINKFAKLNPNFSKLAETQLFIIIILCSTLISPIIGVSSLLLTHKIFPSAYPLTWLAWWVGDVISGLVIAPFILVWWQNRYVLFTPKKLIEAGIVATLLGLLGWMVFRGIPPGNLRPITYIIFPPLIWLSLRFSPRIVITAVFCLAIAATWATTKSFGPFARSSVSESLIYLQTFIGVIAATAMILASAVNERKRLEKKKDEFISVASHELKTPLTSIKIFAEIMQRQFEKKGDKRSVSQAAIINRQIDKLIRLVLELLDIAKIQESELPFHKEKFIINELIKEIGQDISRSSKRKIVIEKSTRIQVVADSDRIGQVLTNLISNAIKYSPQKNKIIVSIAKKDKNLIVGVQDFGMGIPSIEQENIFNKFYKINNNEEKSRSSVGLGLYITKEIIRRHKGKLWVESPSRVKGKSVKGSTFYFTLPE